MLSESRCLELKVTPVQHLPASEEDDFDVYVAVRIELSLF